MQSDSSKAAEISYRFLCAVLEQSGKVVKHPKTKLWGDPTYSFDGQKLPDEVDADLNQLFALEIVGVWAHGKGFAGFARTLADGREDNQILLMNLADYFAQRTELPVKSKTWNPEVAKKAVDVLTERVPKLAQLVAA